MPETTSNQPKISVGRIIKNVFFAIGYAFRQDKKMVLSFMIGYSFFTVANAVFDTYLLKIIIDLVSDGEATFWQTALVIGIGFVLLAAQSVAASLIWTGIRPRLIRATGNIQRDFIKKAANIDLICYDNKAYFDDFVLAASQCEEMIEKAINCTTYIIGNVLGIVTAISLIFTIDPVIAIFPVVGFFLNIFTRFAITKQEFKYDSEKKRINRKSDYSKRVFYQPEFAKEIKLTDIEAPLIKQFNDSIEEEKKMARKYGRRISLISLVNWITVFTFLSFFCIPLYLGYLALVKKTIKLGDVASLNNAANTVRGRLDATNYALVEFQTVGQYAERFRRFVNYKENIETHTGEESVPADSTLEIKNMSYKYDGSKDYTLKNISMTIKPGEKIAIVGENGAGKTTLIKLLMRLYDVTDGSITYGGEDIRKFTTKEYRSKIAAVFQDYQIYAASLAENVIMDVDAEKREQDVKNALALADFNAKLQKLENGVETQMTREFEDGGTMLSGGEAQKVAIARMFAKHGNMPIAILDEPSSALDPVAEYTLNTNMMQSAENSTIIFISHRLSTTREADKIYMFENGEIIEQGTHDELMAMDGEYAKMFEKQAHYYKLKI